MFIGCFITYTGSWELKSGEPKPLITLVRDWLMEEAIKASTTSVIWLHLPYYDESHARGVESAMDKIDDTLKREYLLTQRTRLGRAPTRKVYNRDARIAILYVEK